MMKLDPQMKIILTGAIVLLVWYFASSKYRVRENTEYNRVVSAPKDVLVSIPKNPDPDMEGSVVVMIGGMYGSGPRWLIHEIPEDILETRNVILGEYFYPVEDTIRIGMEALSKNGVGEGLQISSISGFSAGGSQLMNSYEPNKYPRVFLIDPSASVAQAQKDFEGEVVFLYGWDVHEDAYDDEYKEIIDEVADAGGVVDEQEMNHYKFPRYTFSKYKDQL